MDTIKTSGEKSLGVLAMTVREALEITRQELAALANVSSDAVFAFENNLPVTLDSRRKILKELWCLKKTKP